MSQTRTTGVRFDPKTEERLDKATEVGKTIGLSRADIIRQAVKIGLTMLEKVNYDLDAVAIAGLNALIDPEEPIRSKQLESVIHKRPRNKRHA